MAIRVHHNPASQHARRVRMTGLELGLDIEWKLVDFSKGENRSPEYLALNPAGKVPTLEEDGFVLWESNAIMAYLADQKPGVGLYPTETRERALVNRWLFWEAAHFGAAAVTLTWERVIKPRMKQPPDPAVVAQGEQSWRRFAPILDAHLAGRAYVASALSIADFALATILMYHEPAGIDLAPHRHLGEWFARIQARESWQRTAPGA